MDQVDRARRGDRVEELVDQLLDARAEPFDDARRERLAHQRAHARVIGRVDGEQAPRDAAQRRRVERLHERLGGREALVAQHGERVGVARDQPETALDARELDQVDRVLGTQAMIVGVGVGLERGAERVEHRLHRRAQPTAQGVGM